MSENFNFKFFLPQKLQKTPKLLTSSFKLKLSLHFNFITPLQCCHNCNDKFIFSAFSLKTFTWKWKTFMQSREWCTNYCHLVQSFAYLMRPTAIFAAFNFHMQHILLFTCHPPTLWHLETFYLNYLNWGWRFVCRSAKIIFLCCAFFLIDGCSLKKIEALQLEIQINIALYIVVCLIWIAWIDGWEMLNWIFCKRVLEGWWIKNL